MRKYELAYIVHPDLENTLDKVTEKINKYINAHGKVLVEDVWGKRKLAYPIAKQNFGLYVITTAEMAPKAVGELEGILRRTEEVIRFIVVSLDGVDEKKAEKPKKDAPKAEEKEEAKADDKVAEEVKDAPKADEKPKKVKKETEEPKAEETSEEERMEELDKKLKKILGEEEK